MAEGSIRATRKPHAMGERQSTILVVDDNPTNLKLVADVLGFEGHCMVTAMDAKQALAVVRHSPPDLILMDIGLPDMDGLALTRKLKTDKETRHIIIVALTAFAMKGDEGKPSQPAAMATSLNRLTRANYPAKSQSCYCVTLATKRRRKRATDILVFKSRFVEAKQPPLLTK